MTTETDTTTTIVARFIGADGSLGYRHGNVYTLTVRGNAIVEPTPCSYESIGAFYRNWEPVPAEGSTITTSDSIRLTRAFSAMPYSGSLNFRYHKTRLGHGREQALSVDDVLDNLEQLRVALRGVAERDTERERELLQIKHDLGAVSRLADLVDVAAARQQGEGSGV